MLAHLEETALKLVARSPGQNHMIVPLKYLAMHAVSCPAKGINLMTDLGEIKCVAGWDKLRVRFKLFVLRASKLQARPSDPDDAEMVVSSSTLHEEQSAATSIAKTTSWSSSRTMRKMPRNIVAFITDFCTCRCCAGPTRGPP